MMHRTVQNRTGVPEAGHDRLAQHHNLIVSCSGLIGLSGNGTLGIIR